ncbi:MAG: hypothetical protein HZB15_05170 [Actinobacteria bacterium]|nr:hypothetical protein [Actinomycetota bacterium]
MSSSSNEGERFTTPSADRPPTDEEAAAAERAAKDVDLERVAAEYEEMAERGANVEGEGQIEPS